MRGRMLAGIGVVLGVGVAAFAAAAQPSPPPAERATVTIVSVEGRTEADVPTLAARTSRLLWRCRDRLRQAGGRAAFDVELTLDARGLSGGIRVNFPPGVEPTPQLRRLQSCVIRALEGLHVGDGPRAVARLRVTWGDDVAAPVPAPEPPAPTPEPAPAEPAPPG